MPPAREALSNERPNFSIRVSAGWQRCQHLQNVKRLNGIFNVMFPCCPLLEKLYYSTAAGYNRAGVEKVMGFCSEEEYQEFMRSCPEFERMLVRSGIILIKYWFSVSDEEQENRFQSRLIESHKRWKLSPMDLESRKRWIE